MRVQLRRFLSSNCACAKSDPPVRSFHRRISQSRRAPHSLLSRRTQDPQIRVRCTLRVPLVSRCAPGTLHSETECSKQTLRDRRVQKRAAAGRRASTISTANMSEDKTLMGASPSVRRRQAPNGSAICETSSCISKRRSLT